MDGYLYHLHLTSLAPVAAGVGDFCLISGISPILSLFGRKPFIFELMYQTVFRKRGIIKIFQSGFISLLKPICATIINCIDRFVVRISFVFKLFDKAIP